MSRNWVIKQVIYWERGYMVLKWASEECEPFFWITLLIPSAHKRNYFFAVLGELHAPTRVVQIVGILFGDVYIDCCYVPGGGIQ